MTERIVVVVPDLLFQSRIVAAAEALSYEAVVADSEGAALAAAAAAPALLIVDLHAAGIDAGRVIRAAKAAGANVLAFGRHTEPKTLRAARQAGADRVVARSELVEQLPQLLQQYSVVNGA